MSAADNCATRPHAESTSQRRPRWFGGRLTSDLVALAIYAGLDESARRSASMLSTNASPRDCPFANSLFTRGLTTTDVVRPERVRPVYPLRKRDIGALTLRRRRAAASAAIRRSLSSAF